MKRTLFALLLFAACRDQYPTDFNPKDAAQLEGLWRAESHPHRFWHFDNGVLHQQVFGFGQQIIEHWYGYETRADTLFLREMLEPDEREIFTVYFKTDSTAELTDVTNALHFKYQLKRF